jgi:hypothetical protein
MTSYREMGSDVQRIPMVIALRGVTTFPLQGSWLDVVVDDVLHTSLSPLAPLVKQKKSGICFRLNPKLNVRSFKGV